MSKLFDLERRVPFVRGENPNTVNNWYGMAIPPNAY
jgi:hypothetical protein